MRANGHLPVPLHLYRGVTSAAAMLAPAWLAHRVRKGKEDPRRLAERRGIATAARPKGPLIWAHGASVGEVLSILPLIERLAERGFHILLTSGTLTSSRIVARRNHPAIIHQFVPLDARKFVTRFLDHWQPDLALLAESELWPNLMTEVARRGTPLVLVNARLSDRSSERWARLPKSAHSLLGTVDLCLTQSREDGERFRALGAPRVQPVGNLKFDVPPPAAEPEALEEMQAQAADRPVLLAASTHPGEDEMVLEAHLRLREALPGLLTIIAPRHPERGPDIEALADAAGLPVIRREAGYLPGEVTEIYIADTIGELGIFYRLAPVVFVGGSLVRHGGQTPIEAAKLGAVVVHGPHVWNFGALYAQLDESGGAIPVTDAGSLAQAVLDQFCDHDFHLRTAQAAWTATETLSGALDRTLSAIEPYLAQIRLARR
ncbi:3-deoxy-D-manno-octulosonic acid transferase [Aquabacter cavernae]|uniref:3-deoxy-D-manno-octulosonic acid transferase n=1 Tax=Aquabacter cavernae TaxID=2496029 RepID=UPI000F8CC2DA|nr:3-deoxy-D-manno-octulosonic acid transferase [Aquabacter cavernae]